MRQRNGDFGQTDLRPLRLLSLLEDTLVEHVTESSVLVASRWGDFRLESPGPAVRELLSRMSLGPVVPGNSLHHAGKPLQEKEHAEVSHALRTLEGCVVHSLSDGSAAGPLLSAEPVALQARFTLPEHLQGRSARLSRFTVIRVSGERLLVESPLALHRVVLHRPEALRVVGGLVREATVGETATSLSGLPPLLVADTVAYLVAAGVAVVGEYDPGAELQLLREDTDARLLPWTPHDLLFHTNRRPRLLEGPLVGPRPEAAEPKTRRQIPLPPSGGADPPQGDLGRAWCRPLRAAELGELLSRALARPATGGLPSPSSPDPTDGINLYVTVDRSRDIERGIYRYSPDRHTLVLVNSADSDIAEMLDCAKLASGTGHRPAVLFTITAQMATIPRPFEGSPYSTALLRTGALQERLRHTAQELELAASVLVTGDSEVAAKALGLDELIETAIGEFGAGG